MFWIAGLLLAFTCGSPARAEGPNERCLECHSEEAIQYLPLRFGDGGEASAFIDKSAFLQSAHGQLVCVECHRGFVAADHPGRQLPSRKEYAAAMERECRRCHESGGPAGVTRIAEVLHRTDRDEAPRCAHCHPPHEMKKDASDATLSRSCAKCHKEAYASFSTSVHGAALGNPANPDTPACTACHHGHEGGGKSFASQQVRFGQPCIGCHGNQQRMRKYDLSAEVVTTYLKDFHGVSLTFYGNDARDIRRYPLVCADCHGIHEIKPAAANAAAMKANLLETCRKCHPDATENFPDAWLSHYEPSLRQNSLVYFVTLAYRVLIPFVIIGLSLHIAFHLVVLPIRTRRAAATDTASANPRAPRAAEQQSPEVPEYFVRFSLRQRIEHLVMMVTFGILVATGLPQRYFDAEWAEGLVRWLGGIDMVRLVHRAAGYTFAVAVALHIVTVAVGIAMNKTPLTMLPTRKDFGDAIGSLKFYLGLAGSHPRFDRFDYRQKFEYWGMVLGSSVMVASGFILLFPMFFARYLPGQFIAAAKVAHSYEAMMALLTIIVWHMYGARFDPCIFTGKIASWRLAHHHPLEYERLVCRRKGDRSILRTQVPMVGSSHATDRSLCAGRAE